ncbi:MAG: pyrroline-5-carboxylate reductase [Deltaproteobacteria bacterium]|nr:pyrroline-5-carboxylate reductase [Deltaproteobacteria bacterium]MBW2121917.1 pyrroline-5-carboxylate reductase [Deltaproteobacteria bacterium]
MLNEKKIGFIGAGNMAEAMLKGLLHSGASKPANIIVSDIRQDRLDFIRERFNVSVCKANPDTADQADLLVLAVKPQIMEPVLVELVDHLDMSKLIISIAAGIPLATIESYLHKDLRLIRAMPNIAALVLESATAICPGRHASQDDLRLAKAIFDSIGKTVIIEEVLMDAITGLSGSGPAYLFLIIDAMADAGVKVGLSRDNALALSAQTVLGAAKLLIETGEHPGRLKDKVTSPGGTAISGLHTLEEGGLRTTLINAVEVATLRSKELGRMMGNKS